MAHAEAGTVGGTASHVRGRPSLDGDMDQPDDLSSSIEIESVEEREPPEDQPAQGLLLWTEVGDIEAILHS